MDAPLWPARNVAEFTYCPRLFYYMEVEGIHVASHDTEEGNRIHRRVDAPSNEHTADDDDAPRNVRSLTLTCPELALIATLDLAEINGNVAVPIEYRKGRPQRVYAMDDDSPVNGETSSHEVEPWPTDRVHVGLQVILLEHAGYEVPRAILYYAAERRRVELVVDEQLRRDALEALAAAKACAAGSRPLPLVNDPKCPRCSLQSVCLPDEINAERHEAITSPRRVWPPRDDGIHLVAQTNGTRIGVRGAAMQVTDADGTKARDVPLASVESLALLGSVQISTQALHTLADRSIPVAFLSAAGRLVAMIDPLDSVSADTRRNQVRRFDNPAACLELSRSLVAAKIRNQRTLLMRNNPALTELVASQLAEQTAAADMAESIDTLRGHEGQAAALYFANFAGMFKEDVGREFDQHGRQRRPPPDPINGCLSMG